MLVKQSLYLLSIFIFISSIILLIYSIKTKNKKTIKYSIILSITYIIYSILFIIILPSILSLSIGFEILLFKGIVLITLIIFIISIIISNKKLNTLKYIYNNSKKDIIILSLLISFPIIIFCSSFFREMYYIYNSNLIIVYKEGELFNINYYTYAISDKYCEEISIGTEYGGYKIEKYLPNRFNRLNYTWSSDDIKYVNNTITIYRNKKIIYTGKTNKKIKTNEIEDIYYKK